MIHSRVSWMFLPVERSITVSAPQSVAHRSFSTSSAIDEETAELPMFALILTRKFRPMIIGSSSRWLMFDGNDRAAACDFVADEIGRQPLANRDELHLRRDLALARVGQLRDGRAARVRPPGAARPTASRSFGSPALTSCSCGPLLS